MLRTGLTRLAALALLPSLALHAQQTIINTVAGKGRILTGVPGPATGVPLAEPWGMAFDSKGNLYVADVQQNVVFQIASNGNTTVFAGNGVRGYSGDGGPATQAAFLEPRAVAVDAAGNIYIADFHNERVRKVDTHGIVTTIAGGGLAYEGDGVPGTASTVFEPVGLAVDSLANVYFIELSGCRLRMVSTDGIIHNVAGGTCGYSGDGGPAAEAQLGYLQGLAIDPQGNLYIADYSNNRIRKIDRSGIITTFAGNGQSASNGDGGPATAAAIWAPTAVASDSSGNIYISGSAACNCIREVSGGIINKIVGGGNPSPNFGDGGPALSAALLFVYGLAIDASGNLYLSDGQERRIRRVNAAQIINTIAGSGATNFSGDGGPATQAALDFPGDVKADRNGNLYIADTLGHRVRKFTPGGNITTYAGNGSAGYSGDGGQATSAQLNQPGYLAIDASGNLYISDMPNGSVRRVAPNGIITTYVSMEAPTVFNADIIFPSGVAVDAQGDLYVADSYRNVVFKVTPTGTVTTAAGNGTGGYSGDGGPATAAMINRPAGLAVDGNGNLYIAEAGNDVVRQVTPDGKIHTVAGYQGPPGQGDFEGVSATLEFLDVPQNLAADNQGNIYLQAGWYLYRVNSEGLISLLVGGGLYGYQEGFAGDGGPAVAARLTRDSGPGIPCMGITLDPAGNLYFADTGNDRIREITNPGAAAQLAITTPGNYTTVPPTGDDELDLPIFSTKPSAMVITNAGMGPMSWSATISTLDGGNWLQLSPTSGSAPSTVTVNADISNLPPGFYNGTILFNLPEASNSPRYFPVQLQNPPTHLNQSTAAAGTLAVWVPETTGWSASSDSSWLTITSGASGIGMGSIDYAVAANTDFNQRSGTITIAENGGVPFAISQSGDLPASIAARQGAGQSAPINTTFATRLRVTVNDSTGTPVSSVPVTFTAPTTGPGGTFSGAASVTVTTNSAGLATAPAFTANGSVGSYTITASTLTTSVNFSLTNTASGSAPRPPRPPRRPF